jgi:hypothetical protein
MRWRCIGLPRSGRAGSPRRSRGPWRRAMASRVSKAGRATRASTARPSRAGAGTCTDADRGFSDRWYGKILSAPPLSVTSSPWCRRRRTGPGTGGAHGPDADTAVRRIAEVSQPPPPAAGTRLVLRIRVARSRVWPRIWESIMRRCATGSARRRRPGSGRSPARPVAGCRLMSRLSLPGCVPRSASGTLSGRSCVGQPPILPRR